MVQGKFFGGKPDRLLIFPVTLCVVWFFYSNKHCVVVASGFQADIKAVQKSLQAQHVMYEHQNNKPMSCKAVAQQLSNSLYFRRMFPYYTLTICAGLDENGTYNSWPLGVEKHKASVILVQGHNVLSFEICKYKRIVLFRVSCLTIRYCRQLLVQ